MVIFTTCDGRRIALNPDLIEWATSDGAGAVVRLVDGQEHLVRESLDQVAELLIAERRAIVDGAATADRSGMSSTTLHLVR